MSENNDLPCPISLGVASIENRIEGFNPEIVENDFFSHDIVRNTRAARSVIDYIHHNGCPGVQLVNGEATCPYRSAFEQAQELQYVNGETVHSAGNVQTEKIQSLTNMFKAFIESQGDTTPSEKDTGNMPPNGQYL